MPSDRDPDDLPAVPFGLQVAAFVWVVQGGILVTISALMVGQNLNGGCLVLVGLLGGGLFVTTGVRILWGSRPEHRDVAMWSILAGFVYAIPAGLVLLQYLLGGNNMLTASGVAVALGILTSGLTLIVTGVVAICIPYNDTGRGDDPRGP